MENIEEQGREHARSIFKTKGVMNMFTQCSKYNFNSNWTMIQTYRHSSVRLTVLQIQTRRMAGSAPTLEEELAVDHPTLQDHARGLPHLVLIQGLCM